jgi:hypothetical protein
MKRNIGKFQAVPYQEGGEVEEPAMSPMTPSASPAANFKSPQIMGAPIADPGMKKGIMGRISAPRERLTPQSYAGEMAAQKRMKQAPSQSPLGPITGGLKSMGQKLQPQQPAENQPSMGEMWMGEVWQQLTPEQDIGSVPNVARGVGYSNGGSVQEASEIYMNAIRDLSSGGVAGYANGGMVDQSKEIASMGRNGDSMLMHVNPAELQGLQSLLGPMTVNPETGNPEAFAWLPLLGLLAGTVGAGEASGWEAGPMVLGALTGGVLAAGIGGLGAAGAAGAKTAGTGMSLGNLTGGMNVAGMTMPGSLVQGSMIPAAASSAVPTLAGTAGTVGSMGINSLTGGMPIANTTAPGQFLASGPSSIGATTGATPPPVPATPSTPGINSIESGGGMDLDKAIGALEKVQSVAGGQPSQPRPKAPRFPETRMASSQGANPLPGEELRKRRMASGIRTPGMSRIGGSRNV